MMLKTTPKCAMQDAGEKTHDLVSWHTKYIFLLSLTLLTRALVLSNFIDNKMMGIFLIGLIPRKQNKQTDIRNPFTSILLSPRCDGIVFLFL